MNPNKSEKSVDLIWNIKQPYKLNSFIIYYIRNASSLIFKIKIVNQTSRVHTWYVAVLYFLS